MKILILIFLSMSLWGSIGSVMALKGSAEVKRSDKVLKAKSGMDIEEGDELVTKEKSRVQVMLNDDTVVTVGASSSFSFEEFSQSGQDSKVAMRANRGFFRSVTGKIGKLAPERFKVKTASATIGIRGTDFSGEIFNGREVFKCYAGAIFVEFDGQIKDIDAGMMIEVLGTKFEIKEFGQNAPSEGEVNDVKEAILEAIETGEIPTEVISDVTQIINDILSEQPFELTPGEEDRPVQY